MNDDRHINVRMSHLLGYSSVGAVVRGKNYLMTVMDIREWEQRGGGIAGTTIPYVEQVKSALGIGQQLCEPPVARVLDNGVVDGTCIPALRFPTWMKCPGCHLLYRRPWKDEAGAKLPRCKQCDGRADLEQVTWVLVHENGYMADLPWHFLAHSSVNRNQRQCRQDNSSPYLLLKPKETGGWELRCSRNGCAASASFSGSEKLPLEFFNCQQPWLREMPGNESDKVGDVVQVNDARVHSAVVSTALVIPPESRINRGSIVDRLYSNSGMRNEIEKANPGLHKKQVIRSVARKLHCSKGDVEKALVEIERGYPLYGSNITRGDLFNSEHQALMDPIPDLQEDEDFVTGHRTGEWRELAGTVPGGSRPRQVIDAIDRVIEVRRLKEIMVLRGFRRMNGETLVPPDVIGKSDWLPAVELYGEGIFFTLEESILQRWESQPAIVERAKDFERRYQASGQDFDPCEVVPRFLLLHTASHMLIRELEAEAGYPAASLKERIYCARPGKGRQPMAGVLIYVAVPDAFGSLGGVWEQADPTQFLRLMVRAFDKAEWCSLDPVCMAHEGQGPHMLNRSACHACALVPETCCAYGNMLLDRAFLKDSSDEQMRSFLSFAGNTGNG